MTEEDVLERFDKYGEAIRKLKQKLGERDEAIGRLESDIQKAQETSQTTQENYETFRERTKKTIVHLVEDVIEPMEKRLNTPQRGDVKTLEELVHLKEEKDKLINQISTMGSERIYLVQSADRLNNENLALREQIEEKDQIIRGHLNSIGVLQSEKEILQSSINAMQNKIAQLEAELQKVSERVGPNIIKRDVIEVFPYKFATLQKETMSKVLDFVDALFENVDEREDTMLLNDALKAAKKVGLSDHEYEVFTKRFNDMKVNGMPLIGFDNGIAHSTFKPDWIKQYISTLTR